MTMMRKLLCWIGWHDWAVWFTTATGESVDEFCLRCPHCGTTKELDWR